MTLKPGNTATRLPAVAAPFAAEEGASKPAPAYLIPQMLPLIVGAVTTLLTVLVHSLIPPTIVKTLRVHFAQGRAGIWFWDLFLVMVFTLVALAAHLVEIGLWALSFVLCGEFSSFTAAFFYSGNTYTTLGDSTTVLSPQWRLLAPIEAADGMLMFGVTTAIIFAVIHRLVDAKFGLDRDTPPGTP